MNDILFIHPDYPWPNKYPPMGLLYISAYLRNGTGYHTDIIDLAVEPINDETLLNQIDAIDPKIIGISFMTPQSTAAYALAGNIRERSPDIILVAGGVHASALPDEVTDHFDLAVIGEGEETFKAIADYYIGGQGNLTRINGLAYKRNKRFIRNDNRKPFQNLDRLPFPAWGQIPLEKYTGLGMGLDEEKPFMVVISSRGCPNLCIFCASHVVHGNRFRMRSAENILTEIKILKTRYGIHQFDFADDTMTISKRRMRDFCESIIQEGLDIMWDCNARVNTVDAEILDWMKKAGCRRVNLGVESGDQTILDGIKKGIHLDQIRSAHDLARKAGLKTMSFFMIGNPGETREHIQKTLELAKELSTDCPGLTFATPFPGTELYALAKAKGWMDDRPWDAFTTTMVGDDFQPVMRNETMTRQELTHEYRYFLKEVKSITSEANSS